MTARIHKLSGQLSAIERMIQSGRSCSEILHQVGAVRSGVEHVAALLFQREVERITSRRKLSQADLQKLTEIYLKTT